MKILAISPRVPAANKNGDQVLSFNRLSFLAKYHEIQLICFQKGMRNDFELGELERLGVKVITVPWRMVDALWFGFLAAFDSKIPFQCAFYTSIKFRNIFKNKIIVFDPDIVYSVTSRPLCNLNVINRKIIVDLVDSLALNFSRRRDLSWGLKKLLFSIEVKRIEKFELNVVHKAFKSFVVSEIDRKFIGFDGVNVLPLGVDKDEFYSNHTCAINPVVVFSGSMFYQPNIDAILWFVNFCWKSIVEAVPGARLVIAGGNPAPSILRLESDSSITVTGRVDSMSVVINSSLVAIAPMQSGSGMQFKILEAMSCAVPVVATTIGLGDIKAVHNKDILIGDTSEVFVKLVVGLLTNPDERLKIGVSGNTYVLDNHNWDFINKRFTELCDLL